VVHTAGPACRALHRANHELAQSKTLLEFIGHRDTFFQVTALSAILLHTIESITIEFRENQTRPKLL
jgi:hypothetical protein